MNMAISPALFYAVTVNVVRDRKILPAPGTNQIAGFSGYRPLTIKEINKYINNLFIYFLLSIGLQVGLRNFVIELTAPS